jgi:sporulation and spore germination protein
MIPRHLLITVVVLLAAVFGLGFYLLHLKSRAEENRGADTRPVTAPVSGTKTRATMFVADDAAGVLRERDQEVILPAEPSLRAREVLRALLADYQQKNSAHPMPAGADITDVYMVSGNLAVVDLNSDFADGHRSGILVESLTVTSMVQTLAANVPSITQVKFLVNGKERETLAGHADLDSRYDVAAVRQLVTGLQP